MEGRATVFLAEVKHENAYKDKLINVSRKTHLGEKGGKSMGHNASKALMGSVGSSLREVSNYKSKGGAVVDAGLATILESDNTVSKDTSEGQLVGISLGKDLSDIGRTVVCHKGLRVPIQLKSGLQPDDWRNVAIEDDTGLARAYTGTATVMSMRSLQPDAWRLWAQPAALSKVRQPIPAPLALRLSTFRAVCK